MCVACSQSFRSIHQYLDFQIHAWRQPSQISIFWTDLTFHNSSILLVQSWGDFSWEYSQDVVYIQFSCQHLYSYEFFQCRLSNSTSNLTLFKLRLLISLASSNLIFFRWRVTMGLWFIQLNMHNLFFLVFYKQAQHKRTLVTQALVSHLVTLYMCGRQVCH